jgi:hypothetical protein
MLFGEINAIYCENHTEHTDIYKLNSYRIGNTLCLLYKAQPVNAVWENSSYLLWEPYGTHTYVYIYKLSSYLTGNTLRPPTKIDRLILFGGVNAVYCENRTKPISAFCGQNAEV